MVGEICLSLLLGRRWKYQMKGECRARRLQFWPKCSFLCKTRESLTRDCQFVFCAQTTNCESVPKYQTSFGGRVGGGGFNQKCFFRIFCPRERQVKIRNPKDDTPPVEVSERCYGLCVGKSQEPCVWFTCQCQRSNTKNRINTKRVLHLLILKAFKTTLPA